MLRRRFDGEKTFSAKEDKFIDTPFKYNVNSVSSIYAVFAIIFMVLTYDAVVKLATVTPKQLKISDEKNNPSSFIGERSQNHLKQLTSLGQKVVGSYENEVLAVDFLKREINFMIQQAHKSQKIELDSQVVSGACFLDFKPFGLVNNYENVQNIVVKITGQTNSSLLVNCHFDSVSSSPGGSDDGIMCTTMLEIIRVLSKESVRPKHNIVFLFNGAEENPLQGSHGFITQHKWAKECRAVINLESGGSGEREMLFQAGPGNDFLVNNYMKHAPHPSGQSAAEEIFQSNIIPSDTDYRVFRDFGNIPGMDLAFTRNGYIYHTKYDNFDAIKPGTYQHVGDNILVLVRSLSSSDELPTSSLQSKDKTVYFDYIGFIMLGYNQQTALFINGIVSIISTIITTLSLIRLRSGFSLNIIKDVFFSIMTQIISWVIAVLFTLMTAFLLDKYDSTMSWYTRPQILFGLYFCPTIMVLSLFIALYNMVSASYGNLNLYMKSQIHIHSLNLFWTIILLCSSYFFIRSTYVFLLPVTFTTLSFIVIYFLRLENSRAWMFIYIGSLVIPTIFSMYISTFLIELFIPITGRFGSVKNPEIYIGIISTVACIKISNLMMPLVTLLRKPINLLIGLMMIFLITIGCILFSNYGFPYSSNSESPSPQRYWIFHTQRMFHDATGNLERNDSGYFLLNMDKNSPKIMQKYVPETQNIISLEKDCETAIFCGLPIYTSGMVSMHKKSTWIPADPPVFHEGSHLTLTAKENIKQNVLRYKFEATGPDHMAFFLSPKLHCRVINWSFIDFIPPKPYIWQDRPVYFMVYSYGVRPQKAFKFWIDIETSEQCKDTTFNIVQTAQFVHHEKSRTPSYQKFIDSFPDWSHIVGWYSKYESWEF